MVDPEYLLDQLVERSLQPGVTGSASDGAGVLVLHDEPGSLTLAGFGVDGKGELARVHFMAIPGAIPGYVQLAAAYGMDTAQRSWQAETTPAVTLRPTAVELLGNLPNPFNPSTQIRFQLPGETAVWLTIYDALGQTVARLSGGDTWSAGLHTLAWDGRDIEGRPAASGLYFSVLQTPETRHTGKLLLLR